MKAKGAQTSCAMCHTFKWGAVHPCEGIRHPANEVRLDPQMQENHLAKVFRHLPSSKVKDPLRSTRKEAVPWGGDLVVDLVIIIGEANADHKVLLERSQLVIPWNPDRQESC